MAFYEEVTERSGGQAIMSNIREATQAEVKQAEDLHKLGKCPHTIVEDEEGFAFDIRHCVTCGAGLGLI